MKKFIKNFTVEVDGRNYHVRFVSDGITVRAHCSCLACQYKTLCRHVLQCIENDAEIFDALNKCGLWQIYESYLQLKKSAEELKRESKNLKKKFSYMLLE